VATAWHPKAFRSAVELESLEIEQGQMLEWVVAQELWRRRCIRGEEPVPDELYFWASDKHELDFVPAPNQFIDVKRGTENPYNYAWFLKNHPKGYLTIINQAIFETERIKGITLENFLLEKF
jgi:predicted AAA+ superfamily ATPase